MSHEKIGKLSFILALLPYFVYFVSSIFSDHNVSCSSYICVSTGFAIAGIFLGIFYIPLLLLSFLLACISSDVPISKVAIALDLIPVIFILFT